MLRATIFEFLQSLKVFLADHSKWPDRLRRVPNETMPSQQEKVVAAKTAPAGLKDPVEKALHGISGAHASEIDRSAMWTACREQPHRGADHDSVSAFGVRTDGVK